MLREPAPCGSEAAARRHYRHGEPVDPACRAAANRAHVERTGGDPYAANEPEPQAAARNGLPIVSYQYQARTYSWALENIRRAEAAHGAPERDDGASWDREAC